MTKSELKELINEVISETMNEADAKAINRGFNRGLIVQQPTSSLEGAVAKNVENHGHYHADMTLVAKDGREVKGRFEFDSPGAISRGF